MMRPAITYANVVATLSALVVLAGGTAFAASHLGKSSVGKKQLKAKSVGGAELKKNAVTTAKIKSGAVTGAKVKAGTLADADLSPNMPFGRIVGQLSANTVQALPNSAGEEFTVYPTPLSYTQDAGRTDLYMGTAGIDVSPGCTGPEVIIAVLLEPQNPTKPTLGDISNFVSVGGFQAAGEASGPHQVAMGLYPVGGIRAGPPVPTNRNFTTVARVDCAAGSGVSLTGITLDVIGLR